MITITIKLNQACLVAAAVTLLFAILFPTGVYFVTWLQLIPGAILIAALWYASIESISIREEK
jgi:hypothetical protein